MKVLLLQKEVAVASRGRLTVQSVNAKLTIPLMDAISDSTATHRKQYGGGALSMTVMRANVAVPDDAARAYIKELHLRGDSALTSWVVIDALGFWAATMRGLLAGMSLVSRDAPRAASTIGEALEKLAPKLDPETGTVAELGPWIEDFRAQHLKM